jgi:hypothetical protein
MTFFHLQSARRRAGDMVAAWQLVTLLALQFSFFPYAVLKTLLEKV